MKKLSTLLLLLLFGFQLYSQTIFVDSSAQGLSNGTSWANAFTKLQDALAQADSGSQVWVAKGTYYADEGAGQVNDSWDASFYLKNYVGIYGGFAGTETSISQRILNKYSTILSGEIQQDGEQTNNTVRIVRSSYLNATALLDGFTISGATGAGMFNYFSSPTIRNCIYVENISFGSGGAMYNDHASPSVSNCLFLKNSAGYDGGGVKNFYSTATFNNCVFWKNSASLGGGGIFNTESDVRINNCTFSLNSTRYASGGGVYNTYSSPYIFNCIFWDNSGGEVIDQNASVPVVRYSIIKGTYWSATSTVGVFSADPLFVDAEAGDLRLKGCSPAINRGENSRVTTTTDADGQQRIINGQVDMGAYEFTGRVYVKSDATGKNNGSTWDNAFTSLQYALALQDSCRSTQIWVAQGTYYPTETSTDRSASFVMKKKVEIYGGFGGTETGLTQRSLFFNKTILSGDIDGDGTLSGNSYHVVRANSIDYSAVLDGVTVTGGNADGSEAIDRQGGGIRIVSCNGSAPAPRIQYCTFSGNAAEEGGGIYITGAFPSISWSNFKENSAVTGGAIYNGGMSQSTVLNARFIANTAANGGAIYNDLNSVITVTNGEFFYNSATGPAGGPYKGGAVYNYGSYSFLMNCSFSANTASAGYGGAVYNENASPAITNSILWGNSSEIDQDAKSHPTVTYSIVQGGYEGTGNLDENPIFVYASFPEWPITDLSIRFESPAMDAGTDVGVYFTDLNGFPRKQFAQVDMGAYELQRVQGPPGEEQPLTLGCPQDFTVNSLADNCGVIVSFTGAFSAVAAGGGGPVELTYSHPSGTLLPEGKNVIGVTATDSAGAVKTCAFTVTVLDNMAPRITGASATPAVLYPPNHKMQDVRVKYDVAEGCSFTTTLSVSSSEPVNLAGNGIKGPDWEVIDNHSVKLRAERSGNAGGRVYTILITATDASGNTSTATTTVTVPHDKTAITSSRLQSNLQEKPATEALIIAAVPNPTATYFTLHIKTASDKPIDVVVTDAVGRVVEMKRGVAAYSDISLGENYRPGVYQAVVIQGAQRVVVKLIKGPM